MADPKDKIMLCVVTGIMSMFLFVLVQIAWHGVQKAYAVEDRTTRLEVVLPRVEEKVDCLDMKIEKILDEVKKLGR